jgi:hypothetical protein
VRHFVEHAQGGGLDRVGTREHARTSEREVDGRSPVHEVKVGRWILMRLPATQKKQKFDGGMSMEWWRQPEAMMADRMQFAEQYHPLVGEFGLNLNDFPYSPITSLSVCLVSGQGLPYKIFG